jgi:hypothetical protein
VHTTTTVHPQWTNTPNCPQAVPDTMKCFYLQFPISFFIFTFVQAAVSISEILGVLSDEVSEKEKEKMVKDNRNNPIANGNSCRSL